MEIAQLVIDALLALGFFGLIFGFITHEGSASIKRAMGLGSIFVLVALVGALSAVIVPAGNVGVVTAFGRVQEETLLPGIHFRLPFMNVVHTITTRVQPHEFKAIDAASSEYQSVKLTGIMNYHIDGAYASDLYQRVGDDFASKVLDPAFNDYIKTVVPNYHITEILGKRDEIRSRAKSDLQANLAQYHIIVDDIYIANISFSEEYEKAIEAKQVAQQQVETEKQVTQQRIQQAQQNIESAKGDAQAAIERARGQAEANNLLTKSLTPELIQWQMINRLSDKIQIMLLPENNNFLWNMGDLIKGVQP